MSEISTVIVPAAERLAARAALDAALARFARAPQSGGEALTGLHVDSLTLLRVVSAVLDEEADVDLDPVTLGAVRTVDELADWLITAGAVTAPEVRS